MESQGLLDATEQISQSLEQALSTISPEDFNTILFPGSWTAAQVADHILKVCDSAVQVMHGPTAPAGRQPDEKVAAIQALFLDFSTKMQSPEIVLPGSTPQDKEALRVSLKDDLSAVGDVIRTLPLAELCLAHEFPGFGTFTRREWIAFIHVHTQRHIHQLEGITQRFSQIPV